MLIQSQLLTKKFYMPVAPGPLISRPRLSALLDESLKCPFTLVSAPAGFGKTTLLATWARSLPASRSRLCWISLAEEDNEPWLFWTYVVTVLNMQLPGCFTSLLMQLQSPQAPSLKYLLTVLINLLVERTEEFVLILDDYHMITEPQIHTALLYLLKYLPPRIHIIVSERADSPLLISHLRAGGQLLEIRTNQLRCTAEETGLFFKEVIGIQLPDEAILQITTRTEGWLMGLLLLGRFLPKGVDPLTWLKEASGYQCYILGYLTQEVLQHQPQNVQTFLLSTCILEQFSASLCDAVMQQAGSHQMLEWLEQANLFITSLDSKRQWYRYHALFAEALRCQLERKEGDLVPILHHRASLWYAEHDQIIQAILHALHAHQWQWATDLMERLSLLSFTQGAGEHTLLLLRQCLEQLPADIMYARPRLCLASAQMLWMVAPYPRLVAWLDTAEETLTASLRAQTSEGVSHTLLAPEMRQDQENLLGEVIAFRAFLYCFEGDGQTALALCQQALTLLSAQNFSTRVHVATSQIIAHYTSAANDAVAAIESGLQGVSLAQAAGLSTLAINAIGTTAGYMILTGRLHEAQGLAQQAIRLGTKAEGLMLPEVGWPAVFQAEILREWNELDAARALAEEAISLCKRIESVTSLAYLAFGYAVLLRVYLSRRELDAACSALQQFEHIGMSMNQPSYVYERSFFTTVDQVRLWLACGELDRATCWAEQLEMEEQHGLPFAHEREEVACIRVLLAKDQPARALEGLEPVLQRATVGQRWNHVIEMRLLQALALQMCHQVPQALSALSEALHLAEPEGYIRCFVDEGAPMKALLCQLRKRSSKQEPTPYLNTVLAAFQQKSMVHVRVREHTKTQALLDPLSERELEVLKLLAHGASNLEIAQELVIAVDTVKRHVSNIFSKLGIRNRVQAVRQARKLGLLDEEL